METMMEIQCAKIHVFKHVFIIYIFFITKVGHKSVYVTKISNEMSRNIGQKMIRQKNRK